MHGAGGETRHSPGWSRGRREGGIHPQGSVPSLALALPGCSSRQLPGTAGVGHHSGDGGREGQGGDGQGSVWARAGPRWVPPTSRGKRPRGCSVQPPPCPSLCPIALLPGQSPAHPRLGCGALPPTLRPPSAPQLPPCWERCLGTAALSVSPLYLSRSPR